MDEVARLHESAFPFWHRCLLDPIRYSPSLELQLCGIRSTCGDHLPEWSWLLATPVDLTQPHWQVPAQLCSSGLLRHAGIWESVCLCWEGGGRWWVDRMRSPCYINHCRSTLSPTWQARSGTFKFSGNVVLGTWSRVCFTVPDKVVYQEITRKKSLSCYL